MNPISTGIVKMKAKKILPVAAAAVMITHKANCQQYYGPNVDVYYGPNVDVGGDIARGGSNPNETLYGPLKAIELPGGSHPTRFVPYPDIDPEIRTKITNGGLGIICSSCNATGCICPDNIDGLTDVCDFCRGTKDGGIRCYCSPALSAAPCNTMHDHSFGCTDNPELCKHAPTTYFCEAQPWYQDPRLANTAAGVTVYNFKTMRILPEADITKWAERGIEHEDVLGAGNYTHPEEGTATKNVVGTGVAAAAVAAGVAFLMGP